MTNRKQFFCLFLLLFIVFTLIALNAPLNSALAIGGDDQFELGKEQLLHRNPLLASRLSNDQPWLNTIIIAHAFSIFGEYAAIPRLYTLFLMFCLIIAVWHVMGKQTTILTKCLFVAFFLTSHEVLPLSTSAMLEPPALAYSMLAVACSYSPGKAISWWRSYLAGFLFVAAVCTKLTAFIVLPAWCVLLFGFQNQDKSRNQFYRMGAAFLIGILVVIILSPSFSFDALWFSHQRAHNLINHEKLDSFGFKFSDVFNEWSILFSVLLGLCTLRNTHTDSRRITVFAIAWLIVDTFVFLWHKPWWGYYSIHFHIPISILAAQGAGWVITRTWDAIRMKYVESETKETAIGIFSWSLTQSSRDSLFAIVAAIVISTWFGFRLPPFWKEIEDVHFAETSENNSFVPVIQRFAGKAHWMYSNNCRLVFHGGVMQPPELVIMTVKRMFSGELDQNKIIRISQSYHPELLLLAREGEMKDKRFLKWINDGRYVRVMWDANAELWASPSLNPVEATTPIELIKKMHL